MPHPRKRFGQHWLRSQTALNQIIAAANLTATDRVLEIGPGTGRLTEVLLPQVQSVIAVEVDRDLCQLLRKKLGEVKHFLLLEADVLSIDLTSALRAYPAFEYPNKMVANIPYNITGPILERLLGNISAPVQPGFDSIVVLLQKEVAQRLTAQPGTKAYNALSVRSQYLAACDLICEVPAKAFKPPPKVDSAVVRLTPRSYPELARDPHWLETLVKLGFANRRKMLRNNLKSVVARDPLTAILEQLAVTPQARAEALSIEQWVALSNRLQPTPATL